MAIAYQMTALYSIMASSARNISKHLFNVMLIFSINDANQISVYAVVHTTILFRLLLIKAARMMKISAWA